MIEAAPTYLATHADGIPAPLASYLDGTELLTKTQALQLCTTDADGWPHLALLSAGDMLALPPGHFRFALFHRSGTARNLARDGRLALTLAIDDGLCELRLQARPIGPVPTELPLTFFEAEVRTVRMHVTSYAKVTAGVTFVLHQPEGVLARWQRQLAALRAAA